MIKINLSTVLVVVSLLLAVATSADGIGNNKKNNKNNSINNPQVFNIQTTREIASQYASEWDILKGESRRLNVGKDKRDKDNNNNLVQLSVMVHQQDQVNLLENLLQSGAITLTAKEPYQTSHRQLQGINENFSCYRTIDETFDTLNELQQNYPGFVTVKDIGKSWKMSVDSNDGYPIKVIVVSAPSTVQTKVNMMILGGHHSRELPPPELLVRWVELLLKNYNVDADTTWILERTNIHIVPIVNPDGRKYVQDNLNWYYRKNAHTHGCPEGVAFDGVDLNRNWPMFWGLNGGSGRDSCESDFRGEAALSEPETEALYKYFKTIFPLDASKGTVENAMENRNQACPIFTPGLFIDMHSSGDYIYFPWGMDDSPSPNHLPLLTMAAKLAKPGDYTLWGPNQDGFLYFVSGDVTDTTYGIDCIASLGYEVGTEFYEPCDLFESRTLPVVHESLLYAAKTASAPYRIPLGPDILSITVEDVADEMQEVLLLTAQASDVMNIVDSAVFASPAEKAQNIEQVRVYVDVHPYDGRALMSMSPVDGAFDSFTEMATAEIPISDWSPGRHIIFLEAVDTDGNSGAISAVFVDKSGPPTLSPADSKAEATASPSSLTDPASSASSSTLSLGAATILIVTMLAV